MKKIFVVTRGSYSDYRICSIFSTKEKAEKYVKAILPSDVYEPDIEEYILDEYGSIPEGCSQWFVRMQKDDVIKIFYNKNNNITELSRIFKIDRRVIRRIKNRDLWKCVTNKLM